MNAIDDFVVCLFGFMKRQWKWMRLLTLMSTMGLYMIRIIYMFMFIYLTSNIRLNIIIIKCEEFLFYAEKNNIDVCYRSFLLLFPPGNLCFFIEYFFHRMKVRIERIQPLNNSQNRNQPKKLDLSHR